MQISKDSSRTKDLREQSLYQPSWLLCEKHKSTTIRPVTTVEPFTKAPENWAATRANIKITAASGNTKHDVSNTPAMADSVRVVALTQMIHKLQTKE